MKAKEYIAKYREAFESEDIERIKEAATDMYVEFSHESADMSKSRGVKRNSALVAVLEEQNNIWNAVVRAFPEILAKDGFKLGWLKDMPILNEIWK